jgi:hypothetical protein
MERIEGFEVRKQKIKSDEYLIEINKIFENRFRDKNLFFSQPEN